MRKLAAVGKYEVQVSKKNIQLPTRWHTLFENNQLALLVLVHEHIVLFFDATLRKPKTLGTVISLPRPGAVLSRERLESLNKKLHRSISQNSESNSSFICDLSMAYEKGENIKVQFVKIDGDHSITLPSWARNLLGPSKSVICIGMLRTVELWHPSKLSRSIKQTVKAQRIKPFFAGKTEAKLRTDISAAASQIEKPTGNFSPS